MKKLSKLIYVGCVLGILGTFSACNEKADSKPNFIFKPAPSTGAAAKVLGKDVTEAELYKGIEGDIYEAESKLYELKMDKLKAYLLQQYMESVPEKKGLTNDEFLEKYIAKGKGATPADVDKFIKEKNIPTQQINDQLRERIQKYLEEEVKRNAVDHWLSEQTKKSPVEVYIKKPMRPVFDVESGESPSLGKADAKVTIVEFSDFQCPFCARGSTIIHDLEKKYGNKIRVVFKNFPLPFHQHARGAAEAGLCAYQQGPDYFWKMHDTMFTDQEKLSLADLKEKGKKIGLKEEEFNKCLDDHKMASKVDQDYAQGEKLGIKSTPTFFVNGQLIFGAHPIEVFSEIIDEELAK